MLYFFAIQARVVNDSEVPILNPPNAPSGLFKPCHDPLLCFVTITIVRTDKPLPEDLEVRGFVGLKQSLSRLDFSSGMEKPIPDGSEHGCRSYR